MSALLGSLGRVDWLSAVGAAADVAIVAYVIYRVLLLIRRTRAAYTLVGLLVVGAAFLGAHRLNLATLSWMLDNVINYIILIVIIVFQADIRRGLMRVGRTMFSTGRMDDSSGTVEEIVRACDSLAKSHTGALLVLERDFALSELIEPGIPLQARVSKELLCNVFLPLPDNPLHDGAVLIKDKLVQQAGAILPLSKNPGLDKALGTRHRAAIGVTEETDAIAVVVSEQRGSIGLCIGGVLHMGLTAPILRRELLARMVLEEKSRLGWLARLLRRTGAALGGERPGPAAELPRRRSESKAHEVVSPPSASESQPLAARAAAACQQAEGGQR